MSDDAARPEVREGGGLMRLTQHAGEQEAAQSRAEAMAAAAGMTLEEALAIEQASTPEGFPDVFDNHMEAAHPG